MEPEDIKGRVLLAGKGIHSHIPITLREPRALRPNLDEIERELASPLSVAGIIPRDYGCDLWVSHLGYFGIRDCPDPFAFEDIGDPKVVLAQILTLAREMGTKTSTQVDAGTP